MTFCERHGLSPSAFEEEPADTVHAWIAYRAAASEGEKLRQSIADAQARAAGASAPGVN